MYRHRGGPSSHSRSTTTSRNGFPRDEEEIYYENYRLTREREKAGNDLPMERERDKPDISRKEMNKGNKADWVEGCLDKGMEETTGSPPKRLLKWPRPPLSTDMYSETVPTVHSDTECEHKREHIDCPVTGIQPSSTALSMDKRRMGKCDPPLVARTIDPCSIQVYSSSEKTPLLLRLSIKNKAEQTRFIPSPHQDASIHKVYLLREEEDSFASPFLPQSLLSPTLIPLALSASEQRRALIHPIKTREIRTIRLIVLPPLHCITTRTNECGGELLSARLLLSPLCAYRARRLRPVWQTVVPLHASGHHVAVPFTLHLTPPFTVHRIATRVQKLEVVNARTLYRHSPIFLIELTRCVCRQSARLTTVEKEDPQMVRMIQMEHLFPARMTTRTTVRVKRKEVKEVYEQEEGPGEVVHHSSDTDLHCNPIHKANNLHSVTQPIESFAPPQVNYSSRAPPLTQFSSRPDNGEALQKAPLCDYSNPPVGHQQNSGRLGVSDGQKQQPQYAAPREKEGDNKICQPEYNVFVRDANAHKENKGAVHVNDHPAVKETTPSGRLPPPALSPQKDAPPLGKRPFNDFTIPSRPLPTMASLQAPPPHNQASSMFDKSHQTVPPPLLPLRPSSAETTSAEVIDQPTVNKIVRPRTVLPPPPANVPLAPKSAESVQEPVTQPRGAPQPQVRQRDKKTGPPSQPSSAPASLPPSESTDPLMNPPRRQSTTVLKPPLPARSSNMNTRNVTSLNPPQSSSQPSSGPPPKVGYINIIQPGPPKSNAPVLPMADGTQKSSSSGKNKKMKGHSEGSSSGGKKHKLGNNALAKKDKHRVKKKSGSNKKSKFGPRGHEQTEELGKVRLVADAVKAGEIEADPNAQDAITRLIKKATTPLGGKKKKKKKSSK